MTTRSKGKKIALTSSSPPPASSIPDPTPIARQWAPPTTNADKDALRREFNDIYDGLLVTKDSIIAADEDSVKAPLKDMDIELKSLRAVLDRMEDYPPGAWELDRPEIAHWLRNFVDMSPSTLLQRVRLTIQALSARIAELDIVDEEEDEDGIEVDSPSIALHPPPTVAQGALSENIPKCTTCIDNGHYCLRKANQKYGARCTVCAKLRKKCSIVEEVKISSPHSRKASRSKKVPSMEEVAIAVDIPDPNPQSFIGALKQGIKRKLTDRSPEAASSSMRPPATQAQLGARSSASLPLPFAFEEIAPPPSSSPSIRSFASSQSANFETERLRMLLNESQEDLRFQQHQHEQQVAEMARRFDEQQRRWQNKLATQQAFYESMYGGDGDDGKGGSVASGSKTRRK